MRRFLLSVTVFLGIIYSFSTSAHSCIRIHEGLVPSIEHLKNADIIFWGRPGTPEFVSKNGSVYELKTSFEVLKRQRGLLFGNVKVHWAFDENRGCERVFYPGHNYYVLAYKKDGKYWTDDELNYMVRVPSKEQLERDKILAKRMKERQK